MIRIAAIAAVVVAGAGLAGMLVLGSGSKGGDLASCGGSTVAGDLGGPFTLVNGEGETVTSEQVISISAIPIAPMFARWM